MKENSKTVFLLSILLHLSAAVLHAQNPLHTFPGNFSVDGEAANLLRTRQQVRNNYSASKSL